MLYRQVTCIRTYCIMGSANLPDYKAFQMTAAYQSNSQTPKLRDLIIDQMHADAEGDQWQ